MGESLMSLETVETAELLPGVLRDDPDAAAIMRALDVEWKAIAAAIPLLGVLATIDRQSESVVDRLAYQFHVDYYDLAWPVETKRKAVIDSIRLHRIAGTRGAVDDVISAIWGDGAIISEWWEHGGEPGTFDVVLTSGLTQAAVDAFTSSIRKVKRATDHFTVATLTETEPAGTHIGAVYHQVSTYYLEA